MEEELVKSLSSYRYQKAVDCLAIANKLYEDGELGYSQNRAYYALFDAIRSVTALDGFDSSKHSGIISYFNQHYVKTNIFRTETSKIIRLASMLREKSDYEDFYVPEKQDTQEVLIQVKAFLDEVGIYLTNKEVLKRGEENGK